MDHRRLHVGVVIDDDNDWFIRGALERLSSDHDMETFRPGRGEGLAGRGSLRRFDAMAARSDLLFFEWSGPVLVAATRRGLRKPSIARLQSYEIYEWAPKVDWHQVDRVVVVSRAMQARFADSFPEVADRAVVIGNGIDLERFRPPAGRRYARRIGMMAALLPIKRIYEMVLTIHRLRTMGLDYQLRLAGPPGPGHEYRYAVAVQRTIAELGLGDLVTLEGRVEDTPSWYHDIDVFVSNSYWEGAPFSVMEAMASGCHTLAHFWGGAEEMLPPERIFSTDDDLVAKLRAYDDLDETCRIEAQRSARADAVRMFDVRTMASRLDGLWREVAHEPPRPVPRTATLVSAQEWRSRWQAAPAARGFRYFDDVAVHLPAGGGRSFLEIGCGPGGILAEFCLRLGYVAHGVDHVAVPGVVERWLAAQGVMVGKVHKADFTTWSPSQRYDVVGSFGFIEHFQDPVPVVDGHFRLVKPGGHVVITLPHMSGGQWFLHRLFNPAGLRRHNTRCMNLTFLREAAARNSAVLVEARFVGGHFDFWPGLGERRGPVMTEVMNAVTGALRRVASRLRPGTNRWFSPYLIAVYRTSAGDGE